MDCITSYILSLIHSAAIFWWEVKSRAPSFFLRWCLPRGTPFPLPTFSGSPGARLPWDLEPRLRLLAGSLLAGVTSQLQTHLDDTCCPWPELLSCSPSSKCFSTKGHAWLRLGLKETPVNTSWLTWESISPDTRLQEDHRRG